MAANCKEKDSMNARSDRKVALITGGVHGIGAGIGRRLLQEGYCVVVADIDLAGIEDAGAAHSVVGVEMNVADEQSVAAGFKEIDKRFGRLDVLVNSAGILGQSGDKPPTVEQTPLSVWHQVLGVNLTGTFLACRASLPLMRKGGWGRIINVASRAARTRSGNPAYSASKGGVITFSRNLAAEAAPYGITVNCLAPSWIETGLTRPTDSEELRARKLAETPLGRLATVEDMGGAVAFLVSNDASFITGSVLDVNGGSYMQ
jgi:NAD(P)-dependent dehydrogenase (short-subunit alcohol dehydrogenase family)